LLRAAEKNHVECVKLFETAVGLEEKAHAERSEAHKLAYEAFLLDKDAAKDIRIDQLKGAIRHQQHLLWADEHAANQHKARVARLVTTIKDEEKAEGDLRAAEKAETNAQRKQVIEGTLGTIADEIKADQKDEREQKELETKDQALAAAHRERVKVLEAELRKLEGK